MKLQPRVNESFHRETKFRTFLFSSGFNAWVSRLELPTLVWKRFLRENLDHMIFIVYFWN